MSLEAALAMTRRLPGSVVWIAGGGRIYDEAIPLAQRLYLTVIKRRIAGDVKFPVTWRRYFRRKLRTDDHPSCVFLTFSRH